MRKYGGTGRVQERQRETDRDVDTRLTIRQWEPASSEMTRCETERAREPASRAKAITWFRRSWSLEFGAGGTPGCGVPCMLSMLMGYCCTPHGSRFRMRAHVMINCHQPALPARACCTQNHSSSSTYTPVQHNLINTAHNYGQGRNDGGSGCGVRWR